MRQSASRGNGQRVWECASGRWEYADNETLTFFDKRGTRHYEVDLDRCRHAAATLDWVAQVAGKTFALHDVVGALFEALNVRLGGLQRTQCGHAMNTSEERWPDVHAESRDKPW